MILLYLITIYHLDVVDLRGHDIHLRNMILSLQGIVNRDTPKVYVLWESFTGSSNPSQDWLDYYESKGWVTYDYISIDSLISEYKDKINGYIIYDTLLFPHSANVAMTMAGIYDVIVTSPFYVSKLESLGIPLFRDLQGMWNNKIEAYTWQYDSLFVSYCSKNTITMAHIWRPIKEFSVMKKSAIIDLIPVPDSIEDYNLLCMYYSQMEPFSVVLGYPKTGLYERPWVSLSSKYGLVCLLAWSYAVNFSVHSQMPGDTIYYQGNIDTLTLDTTKIYASFFMSDFGLDMMQTKYYDSWDPYIAGVPVNWWLDPICRKYCPGILEYYYETKPAKDYFYGAHGAGRIRPSDFIYLEEFLNRVNYNLEICDLKTLAFSNHNKMDDPIIEKYTSILTNLWGIYNGFGPEFGEINAGNIRRKNGKMWCITAVYAAEPVDTAVQRISDFINKFQERPLFIPILIMLWDTLSPDSLNEIAERLDAIYPGEIKWVRGDELIIAVKQFLDMLDSSSYYCDTINIIYGNILGGNYLSLHENDGNYLVIESEWIPSLNSYGIILDVLYRIDEPADTLKRLWLIYDGHASDTIKHNLYIWNFKDSLFELVGTRDIGTQDYTQEDGIIHNPWNYTSENKIVRIRIKEIKDNSFTGYLDYLCLNSFYYKCQRIKEKRGTEYYFEIQENKEKIYYSIIGRKIKIPTSSGIYFLKSGNKNFKRIIKIRFLNEGEDESQR